MKEEILTLRSVHRKYFDVVRVAHLFGFLCCDFLFVCLRLMSCAQEKFEDTINRRKTDSKMAKSKRKNNDLQSITQKLKIEKHELY
jgi:hypothetical protein